MGRTLVNGRWAWGVVLVLVVASAPRAAAGAPPPPTKGEPAPRPVPFPNVEVVRYDEFIAEVRRVADELATTPEVERGYRALLADYDLVETDVSIQSYSRVRLAFEATRDGGLWGVRYAITDRMPWSDAIWKQWRGEVPQGDPDMTAEAECDELSALFAFLARDLGIEGFAGLFWPTWNHTVAVWQLTRGGKAGSAKTVRVLVPTSQIWLSREASLGTARVQDGPRHFSVPAPRSQTRE